MKWHLRSACRIVIILPIAAINPPSPLGEASEGLVEAPPKVTTASMSVANRSNNSAFTSHQSVIDPVIANSARNAWLLQTLADDPPMLKPPGSMRSFDVEVTEPSLCTTVIVFLLSYHYQHRRRFRSRQPGLCRRIRYCCTSAAPMNVMLSAVDVD
jgi:hypothetical protein